MHPRDWREKSEEALLAVVVHPNSLVAARNFVVNPALLPLAISAR
jgi:hypothetical protein